MFARRRTLRRSTWAVLTAFAVSTLAMAPLGLHAHATRTSAEFHSDFCTAVAPENAAGTLAVAPDKKSTDTERCNDCPGCAGGAVALASPVAPWLAVAKPTDLVLIAQPPAARHDDRLVARPRGPPLLA